MVEYLILIRDFIFALLIGTIIGFEREYSKEKYKANVFGGIRTFILISLIGAFSGYFSVQFNSLLFWFIPFIVVSCFILINYLMTIKEYKEIHTTTEIVGILVFILSSSVFFGYGKFAVALSILISI